MFILGIICNDVDYINIICNDVDYINIICNDVDYINIVYTSCHTIQVSLREFPRENLQVTFL